MVMEWSFIDMAFESSLLVIREKLYKILGIKNMVSPSITSSGAGFENRSITS